MISWLGMKFLGLARLYWLLILAALIAAAVLIANTFLSQTISTAKSAGASELQEANLTETINRTEQGNAARDEIRHDGGTARYDECLRTARTPKNCQRFLP
ncbi:MAG: hypothetical protein BGO57_13135 [Sphingomonadales bacterium 63-6]|nr:MAG: hypothetical protein BGO57_13135 [Sphingomonadales bacterium 63-6]